MPAYSYQVVHADGTEGEVFEHMHRMDDDPLTEHPETGEKVVRVFRAPHIGGPSHERAQKKQMDDKNLDRLGFTKYVRNGRGHYEKRAGKGPDNISS